MNLATNHNLIRR